VLTIAPRLCGSISAIAHLVAYQYAVSPTSDEELSKNRKPIVLFMTEKDACALETMMEHALPEVFAANGGCLDLADRLVEIVIGFLDIAPTPVTTLRRVGSVATSN
jgi:hypothetical protein